VQQTLGAPHPRFPVKLRGFRDHHAPFLKERRTRGPVHGSVQENRGISLVFREMWDTANARSTVLLVSETSSLSKRRDIIQDRTRRLQRISANTVMKICLERARGRRIFLATGRAR
jgi:hypothetical protein